MRLILAIAIFIPLTDKVVGSQEHKDEIHPTAQVSSLLYHEVSLGGGVITVFGSNFSSDISELFQPDFGNRVMFSNDYETLECKTPVDRTWLHQNPQPSTPTMILCNLPPRGTTEGGEWYNMMMFVDGKKVSNSHDQWIQFRDRKTPKVIEIWGSRYIKVEDKVTFYGRIITDRYGNVGRINDPIDDSDSTVSHLGVFLGGQQCDLVDPNGNLYGINLYGLNDCGLNCTCGDITCKLKGTFVGPLFVEYHVSNYGASKTDNYMCNINSKGQVYHFHTLPTIDSVSHNSGWPTGGQLIEISGSGFDARAGKTKVYLGEIECDVKKVTNGLISIRTPPESKVANTTFFNSTYAGGAGLWYQIWFGTGDFDTSSGLDNIIPALGSADNSTIIKTIVNISEPVFDEIDNYTSILSGFFVCRITGFYEIVLESSGQSTLYWENSISNTIENACSNDQGTSVGVCETETLKLEKGHQYFFSVVYNHVSEAPLKLRLGLKTNVTSISSKQHPASVPEKQRIRFDENRRHSKQKVEFIGDIIPEDITFTMFGVAKNIDFSTSNFSEDGIEVVDDENDNATKILTFKPSSCDEFIFDLLGIQGAFLDDINSNDTIAINDYLSSNDTATFSHPYWGNSRVRITRVQNDSNRVTGSYSIIYKGKTLPNLNVYLEDYELERLVQQGLDAPTVKVTQSGSCWKKNYDFEWQYEGGEKPLIAIDTSKLTTDGTKLTSYTEKIQSGHIDITELGVDFFRTPHDQPQLNVVVNNFHAWCYSPNGCSYSYSSPESIRKMKAVSKYLYDGNFNLKIDLDPSDIATDKLYIDSITVIIGDKLDCTVTTVFNATLECVLLDALPVGIYTIRLFVDNFGEALGSLFEEFSLSVIGNTPAEGSIGGGTLVSITGSGFSETNTTVMIGGSPCHVTFASVGLIQCITSAQLNGERSDTQLESSVHLTSPPSFVSSRGGYEIYVKVDGSSASGGSFSYDASITPIVSSHDAPRTLSPVTLQQSNIVITITGTGFGGTWGWVELHTVNCKILSWDNKQITCILPVLTGVPFGTYPIHVKVPGQGYADVTSVDEITYGFRIASISPQIGSLQGGTELVITGEGFTNLYCQTVYIKIGDAMTCEVNMIGDNVWKCSDTKITCTTKRVPKVHRVENTGTNAKFGKGYAWDKKELAIAPGDIVEWKWILPVSSATSGINIIQRKDLGSTIYDGIGFHSGHKKLEGIFKQRFYGLGTSYYTSDSIIRDLNNTFMSGSVTVEYPLETANLPVIVKIGDLTAEVGRSTTQSVSNEVSSCTYADTSCVTPLASNISMFSASMCLAPKVSMVNVKDGILRSRLKYLEGHAASTLEITGSGFGTLCQTKVLIGSTNCHINYITSTIIECSLSASEEIKPETLHVIEVIVYNKGSALFQDEKYSRFYAKSVIRNVNIEEGSFAGGSVMIFKGLGLTHEKGSAIVFSTSVTRPKLCSVISNTYTKLICRTPSYENFVEMNTTNLNLVAFNELVANITVKVAGKNAIFSTNNTSYYHFKYSSNTTPMIESGNATLLGGNGKIIVKGSKFTSSLSSEISRFYLVPIKTASVIQRSLFPAKESLPNFAFHKSLNNKGISDFFRDILQRQDLNEIKWKIGGSGNRRLGPPSYSKQQIKDSARHTGAYTLFEDNYQLPHHLRENEDRMDIETMYNFIQSHTRSNIQNMQQNIQNKSEVELVEEDINHIETSYFGTFDVATNGTTSVTFKDIEAGMYKLIVYWDANGNAMNSMKVTSQGIISSITPDIGSTYGGQQVTITGQGFCSDPSYPNIVKVGSTYCNVTEATFSELKCITSTNNGTDEVAAVEVSSGLITFEGTVSFTFAAATTPTIINVSPNYINYGDVITIDGTNFDGVTKVMIGNSKCAIETSTSTQITCKSPFNPGGLSYKLNVVTLNGFSDQNLNIEYALTLHDVSPREGSIGGGTEITLSGKGFHSDQDDMINKMQINMCGNICTIQSYYENTITCITPRASVTSNDSICDLILTQMYSGEKALATSTNSKLESLQFKYKSGITPVITGVSPNKGGTGGGTMVTITGNFSDFSYESVAVSIDGSTCDVTYPTASQIICYTNAHEGSGTFSVTVRFSTGNAIPASANAANFEYVDNWSSIWTWGGLGTPQEGEFIVITTGQTIILDVPTPKLKLLLLKGGNLRFDKDVDSLQLNSEYIMITEDSVLEVGTENEPFLRKAEIILHGNARSTEDRVYGCKFIAVGKGKLELHGRPVRNTWTHLAYTVETGSTKITVDSDVSDWRAGDEIVITSTNHETENEKHKILSIESDGTTIDLESPLKYTHLSLEQIFGDHLIETRAEVGLLTRNIKVMGNKNTDVFNEIESCYKEYDNDPFVTETCFARKNREELGNDEFGSTLMVSKKNKDLHESEVGISYVEFFRVGQSFRVGRNPINFQSLGNVNSSFLKGISIHNSFNRGITIHGAFDVVIEQCVTYDIKGLAFSLEYAGGENNILQQNLAVNTRQSTSLLDRDLTPAAFGIFHANNKIRHNTAAGAKYFGFWFQSPTETDSFCSDNVPLGEFRNNTAHSIDWYGIWIFSKDGWYPSDGTQDQGYCNWNNETKATFEDVTTWRCKRGAEIVYANDVEWNNFISLDNEDAGLRFIGPKDVTLLSVVNNGLIVAHSIITDTENETNCTNVGILASNFYGIDINNTEFYNFDQNQTNCAALSLCSECVQNTTNSSLSNDLVFENSPNEWSECDISCVDKFVTNSGTNNDFDSCPGLNDEFVSDEGPGSGDDSDEGSGSGEDSSTDEGSGSDSGSGSDVGSGSDDGASSNDGSVSGKR